MTGTPHEYVVTETEVEGRTLRSVARRTPVLPELPQETRVIGQPVPRVDGPEKVRGTARFAHDIRRPRQLEAIVVQARLANRRLQALPEALEAARSIPGVVAAWGPGEVAGVAVNSFSALAERPRYAGEEIAVVVGESAAAARDGAGALEAALGYGDGTHLTDPELALAEGAPPVLDAGPNFCPGGWATENRTLGQLFEVWRGEVDGSLEVAAAVVEGVWETPCQQHFCMETHGAVAEWEGERLHVWTSTQGVFFVRQHLAASLGIPEAAIRVESVHMGGGFGSKNSAKRTDLLAALLARDLGRPVRCFLNRQQDAVGPWNRPPSRIDVKLGADREGRLLAARIDGATQAGAGLHGVDNAACDYTFLHQYRLPNLALTGRAVLTHTPPPSPMRCPNALESAWALEQAIDELAEALGLDPLELRLRNVPEASPQTGLPYASAGFAAVLQRGAEAFGWAERWSHRGGLRDGRRVGVGHAAVVWGGAGGPPAGALVIVQADGSVQILAGAADLGTGTRTILMQVVAEELELPMARLSIRNADTAVVPYSLPSFGSITASSSGPAVRQAAADALRQMTGLAAAYLGVELDEVARHDGGFVVRRRPREGLSWDEVAGRIPSRSLVGRGERGPNPNGQALNSWAAHFVEVEVDEATGEVRVVEVVAAHDSGRVLNPRLFHNQVCGGVTQAIGFALSEERLFDHALGVQLNGRFTDYKVPTIADVPRIEVVDAGPPFAGNELGVKGVAELAIGCTAPAIANAVFHACGARMRRAPITPGRLLAALEDPPR